MVALHGLFVSFVVGAWAVRGVRSMYQKSSVENAPLLTALGRYAVAAEGMGQSNDDATYAFDARYN